MSDNVRFLKGIRDNYDALVTKDPNTFYYVDGTDLYLGEILLSNAKDVADAVKSINANATAIENLQKEIDEIVGTEEGGGSISSQISALRNELTTLISDNTKAIEAEETRATGVESGLRTDLTDLEGVVSTLQETVNTNETDIEGKVSSLSGTVTEQGNSIVGLQGAIGEANTKISTLETDVSDLDAQIATLQGEDTNKSIRTIANEELAAALIPEGALESLDTLQEIAAWIQGHPEDASEMNAAIQALQGSDATQNGKIISLEEAVAAINNSENGILAQSKAYTNSEVLKVSNKYDALDLAVKSLQGDIDAIENEDTGILAQANQAISEAIQNLGLGTAAYKDVEYFEKAGAAAQVLDDAKAYTNEALSWGEIPAASI